MSLTLSEKSKSLPYLVDRQAAMSFALELAVPLAITLIEAVSSDNWSSKDTLNVPVACGRKERRDIGPLRGNE
jgi:hypothetical protein